MAVDVSIARPELLQVADAVAREKMIEREEVLECFKIGGRIDYLMRVVCRDIDHYNELSDFMSRGELGVEKFHGHVVLATDKAFQGYPLDMLTDGDGR